MRKIIVVLGIIGLLAAGCRPAEDNKTTNNGSAAEAETNNQNNNETQIDTTSWKSVDLPETLIGISYPQDWIFTNKTKELVELSDDNEKLNVFYKLDPSFINQTTYPSKSQSEIREEYIATLKNITSRNITTKYREGSETVNIEVLNNGVKEIHNIFFVGTVIVDVYTKSSESSVYTNVVKNIKYRGF